ncbi:hypothetical protein Tco_0178377 [Tanacetum coccineum]
MLKPFFIPLTSLFAYGKLKMSWYTQDGSNEKTSEKPGHVRPANGFYDKLNAMMFVPQKELSQEQAYWIPQRTCLVTASKPPTPASFVHKVDLQVKFLASPSKLICFSSFEANTHITNAYTEKLSALTAGNSQLKAQVNGKTSSGPSTSETPKVLAPGMYNLGSKYIPPPKRANWSKTHFWRTTNLPKSSPRNHSSLPVKSANARRVEAHHRTLNKKNRVDSNLLVKHSVSVSKLNNVCDACSTNCSWYLDSDTPGHISVNRERYKRCGKDLLSTVDIWQHEYATINAATTAGGSTQSSRSTNLYSISLNDMMSAHQLLAYKSLFHGSHGYGIVVNL